jgi:hypothetical protein
LQTALFKSSLKLNKEMRMAVEKETALQPAREEIYSGQALDIVTAMIMLVFLTG